MSGVVGLCTLGELRDQILSDFYVRDMEISALVREKISITQKVMKEFDVGENGYWWGEAFIKGSTDPRRRTYVIDPHGPYVPFPPDIDLSVLVESEALETEGFVAEFQSALLEELVGSDQHLLFGDHKHAVYRRLYPLGSLNLSLCIEAQNLDKVHGKDQYFVDPQERAEVRAFKLLLQRNGLYGKSNDAFCGIACEDFIREMDDPDRGKLEQAIERLGVLSRMERGNRFCALRKHHPRLEKISRYAWDRVKFMVDTYEQKGMVRAGPFGMDLWDAFNVYCADNRETFVFTTVCAPGRPDCGVETSDIAQALCRAHPGKGMDHYLVPCQGNPFLPREYGGIPHTGVYVRLMPKDGKNPLQVLNAVRWNLFGDSGTTVRSDLLF